MKGKLYSVLLAFASTLPLFSSQTPAKSHTPPGRITKEKPPEYVQDEMGPHSRKWIAQPNGPRQKGPTPVIVQIETGMNYFDGQQWIPSKAEFEADETGFAAKKLHYKIHINSQLNVAEAVRVLTPDGLTVKSTPVAIGLYDTASGATTVIAELRDCLGVQINEKQILFENAFETNGISASVLYTVQKGTFEQDVILNTRLDPAKFGFPAATTQIQIYTELYDPPKPDRVRRPIYVEQDKAVRKKKKSPDFVDEVIGFGEFVMTTGKAFPSEKREDVPNTAPPIAKELRVINQRPYLIESLEFGAVAEHLKKLPEKKTTLHSGLFKKSKGIAALHLPVLPSLSGASPKSYAAAVSPVRSPVERPGLVIDYLAGIGGTVNSTTIFQSDTTYFVSGTAQYGGSVIIEGGAVFKFRNSTPTTTEPTPVTTRLIVTGSLTCKSSQFSPAVFTAVDDDSVGGVMPTQFTYNNVNYPTGRTGSTIDPGPDGNMSTTSDNFQKYYGNPYLHVSFIYFPVVNNLRFCFAKEAIRFELNFPSCGATLSHSQFVNCIKGIVLSGTGVGSSGTATPLVVNNALMTKVTEPLTANVTLGLESVLQHCTIDGSTRVATVSTGNSATFRFVNSIFANVASAPTAGVTLTGNNLGFYQYTPTTFGTTKYVADVSANPFVTLGDGAHYLGQNHLFRSKGTTSIGTTLTADLKKRTTQAPLLIQRPTQITGNVVWGPIAARYLSGSPDLGFYYDPIDYLVSQVYVWNATMTVLGGAVVAYIPSADSVDINVIGLVIAGNSSFQSFGSPVKMNHFVTGDVVQENPNPLSLPRSIVLASDSFGILPPPELTFSFTDFSVLGGNRSFHFFNGYDGTFDWTWADGGLTRLSIRDCQFRNGRMLLGEDDFVTPELDQVQADYVFKNNLFERTQIYLWTIVPSTLAANNNLFKECYFDYDSGQSTLGSWKFRDNLFDRLRLTAWTDVEADFNAYYPANSPIVGPQGADDIVFNAAAPPYLNGALGSYYINFSSATWFLFKGSTSPGGAGLYQYTTKTSQEKDGVEAYTGADTELNNRVNIGFHYIPTVSGAPKDSDGDGIPDYIEDQNGDGSSTGETSVTLAQTTSGTADSLNVLYDDFDLDGDALLGRGEKALGKNPVVADNPLILTQFSTGQPDLIGFNVAVNFNSLIAANGRLQLLVDGFEVSLQRSEADPNGTYRLLWDTTYTPAGAHFVQAEIYVNNIWAGAGPVLQISTTASATYQYNLIRGSDEWEIADAPERVNSVQLPSAWLTTASSWDKFSTTVHNPYFRIIWVPGVSIVDCYNAARTSPTLPLLSTVDTASDLGANVIRYLDRSDPAVMEGMAKCPDNSPCIFEYYNVCHMAGLDASLNSLSQASILHVFKQAVWDANYLHGINDSFSVIAPVRLMYKAYAKLTSPPVTLTALTSAQWAALDEGTFPTEVASNIPSNSSVGLTARP